MEAGQYSEFEYAELSHDPELKDNIFTFPWKVKILLLLKTHLYESRKTSYHYKYVKNFQRQANNSVKEIKNGTVQLGNK
jgi:hypothetical protein